MSRQDSWNALRGVVIDKRIMNEINHFELPSGARETIKLSNVGSVGTRQALILAKTQSRDYFNYFTNSYIRDSLYVDS